jgi:hypothetical protein
MTSATLAVTGLVLTIPAAAGFVVSQLSQLTSAELVAAVLARRSTVREPLGMAPVAGRRPAGRGILGLG